MKRGALPQMSGFDEAFGGFPPEERESAMRLITRYLEIVVAVANESVGLSGAQDQRTLSLSGRPADLSGLPAVRKDGI